MRLESDKHYDRKDENPGGMDRRTLLGEKDIKAVLDPEGLKSALKKLGFTAIEDADRNIIAERERYCESGGRIWGEMDDEENAICAAKFGYSFIEIRQRPMGEKRKIKFFPSRNARLKDPENQ